MCICASLYSYLQYIPIYLSNPTHNQDMRKISYIKVQLKEDIISLPFSQFAWNRELLGPPDPIFRYNAYQLLIDEVLKIRPSELKTSSYSFLCKHFSSFFENYFPTFDPLPENDFPFLIKWCIVVRSTPRLK